MFNIFTFSRADTSFPSLLFATRVQYLHICELAWTHLHPNTRDKQSAPWKIKAGYVVIWRRLSELHRGRVVDCASKPNNRCISQDDRRVNVKRPRSWQHLPNRIFVIFGIKKYPIGKTKLLAAHFIINMNLNSSDCLHIYLYFKTNVSQKSLKIPATQKRTLLMFTQDGDDYTNINFGVSQRISFVDSLTIKTTSHLCV